mgnify:CR=1 FL=1
MSDLRINNITDRTGDSGPVIAGVSTVSSGQFVVPSGPTEYRGGRGRGVFYGRFAPSPNQETIDYIEIATTGNAIDFGDAAFPVRYATGCSSSVRAVFIGGEETGGSPGYNEMYSLNFASKGGTTKFGKLDTIRAYAVS